MNKRLKRWVLTLAVSVGMIGAGLDSLSGPSRVHAAEGQREVVSIDLMKNQAVDAILHGNFKASNELITRAAHAANDPTLAHWAAWSSQFESQLKGFQEERHKDFEKFVNDVKKVSSTGKDEYVLEFARDAHVRADDKDKFVHEPWVQDIIKKSIVLAADCEGKEQWLKCLKLYSSLSELEPSKPLWKDKLKLATRHIRLIALYAPDEFKRLQDAEFKEREQIEALIKPATQPSTKPAKEASANPTTKPDDTDNFRIDWHDTVKGIKMEMLTVGLTQARENYYRDVPLHTMLGGGVEAVRALATTKGLGITFPSLKDDEKKKAFLSRLDDLADRVKNAGDDDESTEIHRCLFELTRSNADTVDLPEEVIVSEFADGAFAELDPFTSMIWPNDMPEFTKTTSGEFTGVGIQIQSDDDGSLKVVSPLEDSPAYAAGIKAGDIIAAINGKNAKGITTTQAVKTITGKAHTQVTLTIRSPDHTTRDVTLTRQVIKVASIKGWSHKIGGGWEYMLDPEQRIAYIRLTNFTRTTGDELNKAMDEIQAQHAQAIILDLRDNPGGLLTAAIEVCEKFVAKGKIIVSTRADRETPNPSTRAVSSGGSGTNTDIPLVVLVNQYSASASEIVSGCLKDNDRALIVGERTFGKGSVQMLFSLPGREAALKLTTSHYYLPNGKCIHREENSTDWGVEPTVTVPVTPEQKNEAIKARQDLDVLHALNEVKPAGAPALKPAKDPLSVDAQLSAALLMLRLELNGARIWATEHANLPVASPGRA